MPPPLTPPTQQGASLPLLPLPYRNPQSRRHLAATQGRHAFTHTSLIGLGHIREDSLDRCIDFFIFIFSTSHFSSVHHWCDNIRLVKSNSETRGHPENLGCFSEMFSQLRGKKKDFFMLCPIICWYLFIFYQDYLVHFLYLHCWFYLA